ncbi:MAG TPA: hypothetical protein DEB40_09205 [Elusimicrobia bacterium]|nr:hypothetical protein [Elusimicrobiota bacterium]HBT61906.1 hypothetical protein [Elusimicrobiota bacterium]
MIKVNLVPGDILAKAQQKQKIAQFGLAGGAAALLVVAVSVVFWMRLKGLESTLAEHEAEYKRLAAVVAKVKEAENAANLLRARLKVIDDLDRGRRAYPYFMSDFARSVPPGVRVQTLNTTGGGNSPMKLNITAEARSNEDIAAWVRKMEETGRFGNIELGPVIARETAEGILRGFSLTTMYTPQL